jgi:hypothetical protein
MPETLRINFVTGGVRRYIPEIESVATLPERVSQTLAGQTNAWFRETAGDEWSPARVLGHLIAYAEQNRENIYRMAYMSDPIIKSVDDGGQAEARQWESQSRDQLMPQLEAAVTSIVELLKELPDSSWGRPGQHPESGRRSIKQQVRAVATHFAEHIAQIEAMRR